MGDKHGLKTWFEYFGKFAAAGTHHIVWDTSNLVGVFLLFLLFLLFHRLLLLSSWEIRDALWNGRPAGGPVDQH